MNYITLQIIDLKSLKMDQSSAIVHKITRNGKKIIDITDVGVKRDTLHIVVDISGSMSFNYRKLYDILSTIQLRINDMKTYISYLSDRSINYSLSEVRTIPALLKHIEVHKSSMFNTLTYPHDTIEVLKKHSSNFLASFIITDGDLTSSSNEFYDAFKRAHVPQLQYIIFDNCGVSFEMINDYMKNIIINNDTFIKVLPTLKGLDPNITELLNEPLQSLSTVYPKQFGQNGEYHIINNWAIPAKCIVDDLVEEFKRMNTEDVDRIASTILDTLSALDDTKLEGTTWFDTIQRALCRVSPKFNRVLSASKSSNVAQVLRDIRQEELFDKNSEKLFEEIGAYDTILTFEVDELDRVLNRCMNAPNPKVLIDELKSPTLNSAQNSQNFAGIRIPNDPTPQGLMASCRLLLGSYRKILSMRHGMHLLIHLLEYSVEGLNADNIHDAIKYYAKDYIKMNLDSSGRFNDIAYNGEIMKTIGKMVKYLPHYQNSSGNSGNDDDEKLFNYAQAMRTIAHARDISNILASQNVEFKDQIDIFSPLHNGHGVFVEIKDYPECENIPHIVLVVYVAKKSYRLYYFDDGFGVDRWTYTKSELIKSIKNIIGVVPLNLPNYKNCCIDDYIKKNNSHLTEFGNIAQEHYKKPYDECRKNMFDDIRKIDGFSKVGTMIRKLNRTEISDALHNYSAEYATLPLDLYDRGSLERWLFERGNEIRVITLDNNISDVVSNIKKDFKPLELRIGVGVKKIDFSECNICMEIKETLISKCPNMHFCCADCWSKMSRCPFCRNLVN